MTPDPGSGNRWEPPASQPTGPDTIAVGPDSSGSRPRGNRGLLAGVAAIFLLGGGAAGYAVGQAVTPTATPADQRLDQRPFPGGDHDGDSGGGLDFDGQGGRRP